MDIIDAYRKMDKNLVTPSHLILDLFGIEAWKRGLKSLKYDGNKSAYCKYCYQTHNHWVLSGDHFDPMCWECLICNHFSSDDCMEANDE
jgi:hypothetical protein